ncbi:MAG TPA: DUF4430 domain-containing protein [Clostridiales bacterium]|nr:DUF4430 domain-containing protein [Clostridiales bacterium]
MKKILLALAVILAIILAVFFIDIRTPEKYYLSSQNEASHSKIVLSISCKTVLENSDKLDDSLKSKLPPDGMILPKTEYGLVDGQTVFDVLRHAAEKGNIKLEYKNYGRFVYIQGINGLKEKSCGQLSGWLYKVNGEIMSVSCSDYVLKPGDNVEWVYSCDMGKDVQSGAEQ